MSNLAKIHDLMPPRFRDTMDYDPALSETDQINRWCIEATHSQSLFEFCQWMTESTQNKYFEFNNFGSILQVGREIYSETCKTRESCEKLFAAQGLSATEMDNQTGAASGNQYVSLDYRIPAEQLALFVNALIDAGYIPWQPWNRLAPEAIITSQTSLTLMNTAEDTSRVTFHWGNSVGRGGLLKNIKRLLGPKGNKNENMGLGPYLGTPVSLLPQLFELAELGENDHLADVGCGDGRVLISAVNFAQCKATGLENDERLIEIARHNIQDAGMTGTIELVQGDGEKADFSVFNVVFLFLPSSTLGKLIPTLQNQMKPGSRIVAHEQRRLKNVPKPKQSRLLYKGHSLTVGHVWKV